MPNPFFNRLFDVLPLSIGRSQAVEDEFLRVEQGFDNVRARFPNVDGAVNATHTDLDRVVGLTGNAQAQIDALNAAKAAKAGDTYTGVHNFAGAQSVSLPAPTQAGHAARLVDAQAAAFGTPVYPWITVTANTQMQAGYGYAVRTNLGAYTLTLPASPTAGQMVFITDLGSNAATNNITVARNGQTIMGLAEDFVINASHVTVALQFIENDWRLV
jgi:hypothetical protein